MSCERYGWSFLALNRLKKSKDLCKTIGMLPGFNAVCGTKDFDNELDRRALCELFCCCLNAGQGQRCVANVLKQADAVDGYKGYYKQEVPFRSGEPVMSRNEPDRATRSRPGGSRIPDVVVVKDPNLPPTVDNAQRVYEMKFPGDGFSPDLGRDGLTQFEAYEKIFGDKFLKDPMTAENCKCKKDDDGDGDSVLKKAEACHAERERAISLTERVNADTAAAVGAAAGATALGRALQGIGALGGALARALGMAF